MTKRQHQLLAFIASYTSLNGICPSYDEMMIALGLKSKSGIHRLIVGLEERGHIRRRSYRSRSVRVVKSEVASYAVLDRVRSDAMDAGIQMGIRLAAQRILEAMVPVTRDDLSRAVLSMIDDAKGRKAA